MVGCGEGQQANSALKIKIPTGDQNTSPADATKLDTQQSRQGKLNDLLKKAEAGDVLATLEIGKAYDQGKEWGSLIQLPDTDDDDPLVDRVMATQWYYKAAESGNAEAQGRLGYLFAEGKGVQRDFAKAVALFQQGAAQGNAIALYRLAGMYVTGRGVPKDGIKSNELIKEAAAKGLSDAQFELGTRYQSGMFGLETDKSKAVHWFQKAADQEDTWGQWYLGRAYEVGDGVPQDHAKAIEWFTKAATQGNPLAQRNLGQLYMNSRFAGADRVLAYAWSNLASTRGDQNALQSRDLVARQLTPEEIAEAQQLSSSWKKGVTLSRPIEASKGSKQPHSPGVLTKKNTGTAFIVNASGHAITNHHVVEGCTEVRAEGLDGLVKVLTSDVVNDIAQLQISGVQTAQATIASDPAKLRQGEEIVVFGFPLNAVLSSGGNLTPGVVSALTGLGNNTNQIQITAAIQPGSSGSPVINKKGEVVGVVAMKLSDSKMAKATGQVGQNVNFAVSGQTLKTFLDTHKVEYRSGGIFSIGGKSTADLADQARKWTLVVECWK